MPHNIFERLLTRTELTGEAMPGQILVEIFGNQRVLIENHQGVLCYGPTEIRIKFRKGNISVQGSGMTLAHMTKYRLVITGCISGVCFN